MNEEEGGGSTLLQETRTGEISEGGIQAVKRESNSPRGGSKAFGEGGRGEKGKKSEEIEETKPHEKTKQRAELDKTKIRNEAEDKAADFQ